jgi:hypothetical protein
MAMMAEVSVSRAAAITPLAGWPIFAWYARAALVMASSGNV